MKLVLLKNLLKDCFSPCYIRAMLAQRWEKTVFQAFCYTMAVPELCRYLDTLV